MPPTSTRTYYNGIYHFLLGMLMVLPHAWSSLYIDISQGHAAYFLNILVVDGLLLFLVYVNFYYLIPKVYKRNRRLLYFIYMGVASSIYVYICFRLDMYFFRQTFMQVSKQFPIPYYFFNVALYAVIAFLLVEIEEKQEQEKKVNMISIEQLNTEVNYLRTQINPHFLFNTLNNLYGMTIQKSDKAPDVIIRLAKIMDFMIYELDGSQILLKRDLENIENYIEIERIRQGNNARISLEIVGDIDNQKIEPLLLLPLVENAFKHGVNGSIADSFVDMHIEAVGQRLTFTVTNNFKIIDDPKEIQSHKGFGLINLAKRLDLCYPDAHTLTFKSERGIFHATLTLNLR